MFMYNADIFSYVYICILQMNTLLLWILVVIGFEQNKHFTPSELVILLMMNISANQNYPEGFCEA